MISLIQRVTQASVKIENILYSQINNGYLIFLGIFEDDTKEDVKKLAEKIAHLRIISDVDGKMNRSIIETNGDILLISQFTLCADVSGGRRPSFIKAKKPEEAEKLYHNLIDMLMETGLRVKTGKFGTYMHVHLSNDGPVTIIVDSKKI